MNTVLLLALGAVIATIIGGVRTYYPDLPAKYLPLIAIGLAFVFLAVGVNSGEVHGGFTLLTIFDVINQAATALGIGRGASAIAGRNEEGIQRIAAMASAILPGAPAAPAQVVMAARDVRPTATPVIVQDPPPTPPTPPTG